MTNQDNSIHVFHFLNEVLGGDKAKIAKIAGMTVSSIEKDVEGVYVAYESKDITKAHDHLHKMKSNLAHLDLREISSHTPDHKEEDFWHVIPTFLREVQVGIKSVKKVL